jgi:hypothetical protein
MRHRRAALAVAAFGLVVLAARQPTADFKVLTHVAGDPAPARIQAAFDLGVVGVSVLYTWSRQLR